MLLENGSVPVKTLIAMPLVPDAAISEFAFATSGAVHAPAPLADAPFVYGQNGVDAGKAVGRIWQVGVASAGPPKSLITAERSVAKFTACRTLRLSNGAARAF